MWHIPYKTPWNWNGTSKDLVSGFVKIWARFNHSTFNERLDKRVTKCKFVTILTTFMGKLTFVIILVFVIVVVVSETGIGRLRGSVIRLTNYLNDKTKTYRKYLSWLPGSVKASQGGSPCNAIIFATSAMPMYAHRYMTLLKQHAEGERHKHLNI